MKRSLISELVSDAASPILLSAVSIGFVIGTLSVIIEVSFASMIFSGDLAPMAMRAVGLTLGGSFLLILVSTLSSTFKSVIALSQDAPTAVMASIAMAVSAGLSHDTPLETRFAAIAVLMMLASLLAGAAFVAIGRFRLANLLRFMPYPVVGGFLAGTGWLLASGSIQVMCGVPVSFATLPDLATAAATAKWLPGVAYGALLFLAMLRWSHILILPGSLLAATTLFYIGFAVAGLPVTDAKQAGFLVSGVPVEGIWPAFTPKHLAMIDWHCVAAQVPGLLSVVLVTVVGMLLNTGGIELAKGDEVDMNKEFIALGKGNLFCGLGGSLPGYNAMSLTLLGAKTGADSRLTGLVTAIVVGGVLFFGGSLLEYFPTPLLGGLILLLGLFFIYEWIVETRTRLPLADYLIVLSIFLVVALFGFMQGVAFGLVATVIFFVIRFSRVPVVRKEFNISNRRSKKDRAIPHRMVLRQYGERVRGYELSGYIFFGSSATLVESLKRALTGGGKSLALLLDFSGVSGFDISAINNFHRLGLNARAAGTTIAVTSASTDFEEALKRNLPSGALENIRFFEDLDHGLEWCEDHLIDTVMAGGDQTRDDLFERSVDDVIAHLERQEQFESLVEQLSPWLTEITCRAGESIVTEGQPAAGLFLLTAGTATETEAQSGRRLCSLVPGDVIIPAAAFGDTTAPHTVIAGEECRASLLTGEARELLESEDPTLALRLHGYLLRTHRR